MMNNTANGMAMIGRLCIALALFMWGAMAQAVTVTGPAQVSASPGSTVDITINVDGTAAGGGTTGVSLTVPSSPNATLSNVTLGTEATNAGWVISQPNGPSAPNGSAGVRIDLYSAANTVITTSGSLVVLTYAINSSAVIDIPLQIGITVGDANSVQQNIPAIVTTIAFSGAGSIQGTVTNQASVSNGTIIVAAATDPYIQNIVSSAVIASGVGGNFSLVGLVDSTYYVGAFLDVDGNQIPGNSEPRGQFGGSVAVSVKVLNGVSTPMAVDITILDAVANGGANDPYAMLDPKGWSKASFNNDPHVIFSPRIDHNISSATMLNPVDDGSTDSWIINPYGQKPVTVVLGAIDSNFLLDVDGYTTIINAGTSGSLTVPPQSAITVTVSNQGDPSGLQGAPYHYQLAVMGASQMFVKHDGFSPNAYSNDSSTPELGKPGAITRWYYEMPSNGSSVSIQFDWSIKASFPDGGVFGVSPASDVVGSIDLYSISAIGQEVLVQSLGSSLASANFSGLLDAGGRYFVRLRAAGVGVTNANNHYTIQATTGTTTKKLLVHRLYVGSIDPSNYSSPVNTGVITQAIHPLLMADFEDATGFAMGSVAVLQAWMDPYSLTITLPTDTALLDTVVTNSGVAPYALGGGITAPGMGFLLRFRIYNATGIAANGSPIVQPGDLVLQELPQLILKVNDSMQDLSTFQLLSTGWYEFGVFGATAYAGGAQAGVQAGVQAQTLLAVDGIDVYSGFVQNNSPVLFGAAASFDSATLSATIFDSNALDSWLSNNSGRLKTNSFPLDHYTAQNSYILLLQAYDDLNGNGKIDVEESSPQLQSSQELVYFAPGGTADTLNGVAVPTGWSLHSFNNVLGQDTFTSIIGGEVVRLDPLLTVGSGAGVGTATGPGGLMGGFGPSQTAVTLTNPKVALALLDTLSGTLSYQFDLPANSYASVDTVAAPNTVALLLDGYTQSLKDSALPGAILVDPTNPASGSGYVFKLIAYDDANNDGKFTSGVEDSYAMEADTLIVYAATDMVTPDGSRLPAGSWGEFNQATQQAGSVSGTAYALMPFVAGFDAIGGGSGSQSFGSADGSISGSIVDSAGNPVPFVFVNFEPTSSTGDWGGVSTDANGAFSIKINAGATYRVRIDTFGTALKGGYYDGKGGAEAGWDTALLVTATATGTTLNKIVLGKGTVVTVKITDSSGNAVPNLWVNLEPVDPSIGSFGGAPSGRDGYAAVSVSNGDYRIWIDTFGSNQVGGYYDAATGGVTPDYNGATIKTVNADTTVTVQLQQGLVISGTVKSAGVAVADVGISVSNVTGSFNAWGFTDATGAFSVTVSPNDDYRVEMWPASQQGGSFVYLQTDNAATATLEGVLSNEQDPYTFMPLFDPVKVSTQAVDLTVNLEAGVAITGQITDGSKGLANVWVDFNSSRGGGWAGGSTNGQGNFSVTVKKSVDYTMSVWPDPMSGIPGGQVISDGSGGYTLTQNYDSATPVNAGAIGATVNVRLSAGVTIDGYVTVSGTAVADAWVNAWSDANGGGGGASTDAMGYYTFSVLAGNGYVINVWTEEGVNAYYATKADGTPRVVNDYNKAQRISVSSSVTGINFNLPQQTAISGRVTDANGVPQPWIWVEVRQERKNLFFGNATDADGFYKISVPEGRGYTVVVWGQGDLVTTYYSAQGSQSSSKNAQRLNLVNGSLANIDIVMSSGNNIQGTVVGLASGDSIFLNAWSDTSGSWGGVEVKGTGSAVTYSITGLTAASDFELSWWSDKYLSGFYGGNNTTVGWENRTLIDSSLTAAIDLTMDTGGTIDGYVTGLASGEQMNINAWSDVSGNFGWAEITGGGSSRDAFSITGLGSATDYRINMMPDDHKGGFVTASNVIGSWDAAALLTVNGTTISLGDIALSSGKSISGSISGLALGETAWINAFSESTGGWGGIQVSADSAVTDQYGFSYTIKGLDAADDYRVSIFSEGKGNGFYGGSSVDGYGNLSSFDGASLVSVVAGNVSNINIPLSAGVSISGTVNGLKQGDSAWVDAFDDSVFSGSGTSVVGSGSGSDSFTIGGLMTTATGAAGYRIHINAEGFQDDFYSSATVHNYDNATLLNVQSNVTGVDFTLSTGNSIAGTVTGLVTGSWGWVDAFSSSTGAQGGAPVSATGSYVITGLAAVNDYYVSLTTADLWLINDNLGGNVNFGQGTAVDIATSNATGVDFNVSAVSTFAIVGSVSGLLDSYSVVTVTAFSDRYAGFSFVTRKGNGNYRITGLPQDDYGYVVTATAAGVTDMFYATVGATQSFDQRSLIVLNSAGGDVYGVDFSFANAAAVTVSGTVTNVYGASSGLWVQISPYNSTTGAVLSGGKGDVTDSKGNYSVDGLKAGTYLVETLTDDGDKIKKEIIVSADAKADMDNVHDTQTYDISGTSSTAALSLIGVIDSNNEFVKSTVTDSQGVFTMKGFLPGTYSVIRDANADGQYGNTVNGVVDVTVSVTITAGSVTANP